MSPVIFLSLSYFALSLYAILNLFIMKHHSPLAVSLISISLCAAATGFAISSKPQKLTTTPSPRTTRLLERPDGNSKPIEKVSKAKKSSSGSSRGLIGKINESIHIADSQKKRPANYSAPASENMPVIYGCIEYSGSSAGIDHTLCRIPTNDSESFEVIVNEVNAIDGGTLVGDIYYGAYHTEYYGEYQLYINGYDINDGTRKYQRYGDSSAEATDVAYNPADGKVYGCFCDPDSPDFSEYYFGTIDYSTGVTTRISDLPRQMAAIAINSEGTIYVIDKQQEQVGYSLKTTGADLYTIDATNGEMTFIGKTGLLPEYRTSACIDPASGRMFWTLSPDDELGYLYEINTSNGLPTLIYTFPGDEEIVGLFIKDSGITAGSPAAASNLSVSFPNGEMNGTVSFSLPSLDNDGNTLFGNLNWSLYFNELKKAEGSGYAGQEIELPVEVEEEGVYTISVIVSNSEGNSPEAIVTVYIGYDTPLAPSVNAELLSSGIKISWEPVTETVNGNAIDPNTVSYDILRLPDNEELYNYLSLTEITDIIPDDELAFRQYKVRARVGSKMSEWGVSPKVFIGALETPFEDDFNKISDFDFYTVIDNNNDGITWGPYIGNIQVAFNSDAAMDDWLITPPVMLYAGKAYKFSIDVLTGNGTAQEKFEVKWGLDNNVEYMTEPLIELQSVAHTTYETYHGFIIPKTTGRHFIGIHGCSDADMYTITVDNLKISDEMQAGVPGEIEGFTVQSRTDGSRIADISMNAPATDVAGLPLSSLSSIIVTRYGEEIKRFNSPAPGALLSFTDEVPESGNYEYTVYAENDLGEGPATSLNAYVGALAPGEVSNVTMKETSVPGQVTVSWEAPQYDIRGNALNPEFLKYRIYVPVSSSTMDVLIGDLTETTATFQATTNPEIQSFAQYVVVAETDGGISDGIPTPLVPVGAAYKTPFRESFSNGKPVSILGNNNAGGANWQLFNSSIGVEAADYDNGFIGSVASYAGDYGTLIMGKVDLAGMENPTLSFYTFSFIDEENVDNNEIEVTVICDGVSKVARRFAISELTQDEEWVKVSVPLDEYKGKQVNFTFTSYANVWSTTLLDCIRVDNHFNHNLSLMSIEAPEEVKTGNDFVIKADIENNSQEDVDEFAITLLVDGEIAEVLEGCSIGLDERKSFEFTRKFTVLDEETQNFTVRIDYASDEYDADNAASIRITPIPSTLPWVETLTAEKNEEGILLSWEAPDPDLYIPDSYTEDFETATPWASKQAVGWTFVDRDGGVVGGFSDGSCFPGIPQGSVQSFFVIDNTSSGYDDYFFHAYSGTRFLGQMFSYNRATGDGVVCDDWAISPELCGKTQMVSLKARCFDASYPETFEILYSDGSMDPEDFILANACAVYDEEWATFTAQLPEGARRLAVRCTSDYAYMLFVDDITFIPESNNTDIEVTGYRVYRDNQNIQELPASMLSWLDNSSDTKAIYRITALYNEGESRPSAGISADDTGIKVLDGLKGVYGGKGFIRIRNAAGSEVSITDISGKCFAKFKVDSNSESVELPAGVYLVEVDKVPAKVIVR